MDHWTTCQTCSTRILMTIDRMITQRFCCTRSCCTRETTALYAETQRATARRAEAERRAQQTGDYEDANIWAGEVSEIMNEIAEEEGRHVRCEELRRRTRARPG
ncbi:hypothetical protein EJ03DRAFT_351175 [Teratosphaeria nubilosa]|uniref:Uncharacterized protein n=1 Tax=Teratosphaeria nubilosa TaxID=161662 RepID=A0A6G1L9S2_9PEZI|nr:hypothetical protein EJ03DRAFT_351175 [Teratosphaeria nubilosa]